MNKILTHHRFLGVVFIGLLVLGVWLVSAVFTQKFISFDRGHADAPAPSACSCPRKADVKVRGVIVGQVNKAESEGDGATLDAGHQARQDQVDPAERDRRDPAQDAVR